MIFVWKYCIWCDGKKWRRLQKLYRVTPKVFLPETKHHQNFTKSLNLKAVRRVWLLTLAITCYEMIYYFALVNQFTSRPSRFDAARENFGPLVCSFRTFGTSYPAGADNHRGRNFNVFRPPVNPLDFTCCVCMLVVCCECLFFYIRQYTVKV